MNSENDTTKDLTGALPIEQRLTAIEATMRQVLAILEDKSRDTRPMLNSIHKELSDLNFAVREMAGEMATMKGALRRIESAEIEELRQRVEALEKKAA
jgi:archaellum component FlaC